MHDPDGERLQKVLASAGVGSRRACEELISQGRVEVDGQVVTELGVRIDPSRRTVHVDGVRVQLDESKVYLAFNKPAGVVTTRLPATSAAARCSSLMSSAIVNWSPQAS